MVASAIFIMDTKGKVIIARNYRGDIPMSVSERYSYDLNNKFPHIINTHFCRFSLHIQEKDEMELRPVFTEDGITFVYIKVKFFYFMSSHLHSGLNCFAVIMTCH